MPLPGVPPVEIKSPEIPIPVQTDDITQVVYGKFGEPVSFAPRNILFYRKGEFRSDIFSPVEHFPQKIFERHQVISIARTYALGDAIMAIPMVKWIKKKFPEKIVIFLTQPPFHDLFKDQPDFAIGSLCRGQERMVAPGEICINLDFNTFECDHCIEHPFSRLHRCDILYELFGISQEERTYDFSLSVPSDVIKHVTKDLERFHISPKNYFLFAWRGSNPIKTFPFEIRSELVRRLSNFGKVVIIDSDRSPEGMFSHPNVAWMVGKSLQEVLVLSALAKSVVTTDSGPLWFSHITKTPVVCFLGPTTEETRLSKHPLYGEKLARKVELKDFVGCPAPCVHNLGWCNGEISCIRHSPVESIWGRIEQTLREMGLL